MARVYPRVGRYRCVVTRIADEWLSTTKPGKLNTPRPIPNREAKQLRARLVLALASSAEEGRGTLRKAQASRVQTLEPVISEWGNPAAKTAVISKEKGTW